MKDYFVYLKSSVAVSTRAAYLEDIIFFCEYIVNESGLTDKDDIKNLTVEDFKNIKSRDVNLFLGDYCPRYYKEREDHTFVYENNNRALARKKSSISTLFKFLYRNEQLPTNITITSSISSLFIASGCGFGSFIGLKPSVMLVGSCSFL